MTKNIHDFICDNNPPEGEFCDQCGHPHFDETANTPKPSEALEALEQIRNEFFEMANEAEANSMYCQEYHFKFETIRQALEEVDNLKQDLDSYMKTANEYMNHNLELEAVLTEIDEYLDINELTQIGHGSILHKKIKSVLSETPNTLHKDISVKQDSSKLCDLLSKKISIAEEEYSSAFYLNIHAAKEILEHLLKQPPQRKAVDVEGMIDDLEVIIGDTHDIDVRDRDYAKAIAGHLHQYGYLSQPPEWDGKMRRIDDGIELPKHVQKPYIERALKEGLSARACSRIFDISHDTCAKIKASLPQPPKQEGE